jgi:hypothetical protein
MKIATIAMVIRVQSDDGSSGFSLGTRFSFVIPSNDDVEERPSPMTGTAQF